MGRIHRDKSVNLPELPKNNNLSTEKGSWFGKVVKEINKDVTEYGKDIDSFVKDIKHAKKDTVVFIAVAAVVAVLALAILAIPILAYYLTKDSSKDKQLISHESPKELPNLSSKIKQEPVGEMIEKTTQQVIKELIPEKTGAKEKAVVEEKLPNLGELKAKYPDIKILIKLELLGDKNEDELVDLTKNEQFIINQYFRPTTIKNKSIAEMKKIIETTEKDKKMQGYLKDLTDLKEKLAYYQDENNYSEISSDIINGIDPKDYTNEQIKEMVDEEIHGEIGRIQIKLTALNKTIDGTRTIAYG